MAHADDSAQPVIRSFLDAQEAAVLEIADQGLISLAHLVETGAIDVAPSFQRRDRWDPSKQSRLIESFLTNIPVPPVYLAEDAARLGSYAVIDGKQRLTAIATFFADKLRLRGLDRLQALNGLTYSTLPVEIRNPLGMKNLRVTTLLRQSDEELKHEVFLRLNTGGEVLNAQEIRNVAYRGPLNAMIYDLAENEFLRRQFKIASKTSNGYKQMVDAEFVLRFLTLSSRWKDFRGELRSELDRFMREHRFDERTKLARTGESFERCIEAAEAIWGLSAFKRPGRDQALAGLFDAQMIALFELEEPQHAALVHRRDHVKRRTSDLFDDPDFDESVRRATNTPQRLRFRTERMIDLLANIAARG